MDRYQHFVPALLLAVVAGCSSNEANTAKLEAAAPHAGEAMEADGRGTGRQPATETTSVAAPAAPLDRPATTADIDARLSAMTSAQAQARSTVRLAARPAPALYALHAQAEPVNRERYGHFEDNPLRRAAEHPVSTFSIDVDTGAYANVRRMLTGGRLPPTDAVRVEEMLNYFSYDYPQPADAETPFSVTTEVSPTPWNPGTHLLHVGIQGRGVPAGQMPPANLVFLVDVSGSMQSPDKLELLKRALELLARQLRAEDRIAIVVYAGASGVALQPVPGDRTAAIRAALQGLDAGGSTNGAAGIRLAYDVARAGYIEGGINRVLLATDGDFNVGTVNFQALVDLVSRERASGISLTTLGFGAGNYNDHLMERLADAGNGNHAYIDSLREARKALVRQLSGTLHTIASDVKIQIEFNPAVVEEYRLIGYENRMLRREDFNNDKVDAGEIGASHTVTALYEFTLAGSPARRIEPLRYGTGAPGGAGPQGELGFLRLRYKAPGSDTSRLIARALARADVHDDVATASPRHRFSAAVAGFGQLLRGGVHTGAFGYEDVIELARGARGQDRHGDRAEFLELVELARALAQRS